MLDVACGFGRHLRWFCQQNHPVVGVDAAQEAIDFIASLGLDRVELLQADLEAGPWPWQPQSERQFGAVVVTNYLWRPLWPALLGSLQPGGVLLYETFAQGQQTLGGPANPDFLLRPGELLQACVGLRVVAFEDGFEDAHGQRPARFVQRIAAVHAAAGAAPLSGPLRYCL